MISIEVSKLKTASNYAKKLGCSRQTVYTKIKDKEIKSVEIDGILFVDTR